MFVLLMVLWLAPWDRMRAYVLKVQLKLAGVVGDSYVLLEDPVQRRAILDRVRRDLKWLIQRCRSVVLIAHSQGAAVAELVLSNLERSGTDKINSFVTLGAGIQTLKAIEKLSKIRAVAIAGWLAIGSVIALAVSVAVGVSGAWPVASALGMTALVGLLLAAARAWNVHPGRPSLLPRAAWLRPWFDFFSTKDLVPYGPLVDPENNGDNYRPKEVRNRDSYLVDHVEYWHNPEQVVGPLARQIGTATGFAPLASLVPDDAEVLDRLERARFSRLAFMSVARGVIVLATAMLLAVQWPAWVTIGRWAPGAALPSLSSGSSSVPLPEVSVWLQALVVLLPLAIQVTLMNAIFDAWTTAELERLLRRSAGSATTNWVVTFTLPLVLMLVATIYFVRPIAPRSMALITLVGALALVWPARRLHARRVNGSPTTSRQ